MNGLPAKNKKSPCVQMGGLCSWLQDLVISVIPWSQFQQSGKWVAQWEEQTHLLAASRVGCSLVEMSQGSQSVEELVCTLCTQSRGSWLWFQFALDPSKPRDCSRASDWLGYSLVDRPQPAPDSPHCCHRLAETFPVVILILTLLFPLWLWSRRSSSVLWFPCLEK